MSPTDPQHRQRPPEPPDDWDAIDRLTRRCGRAAAIGIPTWLVLLVAFNEELTGIPPLAGFTMASILALIVVIVADLARRDRGGASGLGVFGRLTIVWVAVFTVLALLVARSGQAGAATVLAPFLGASVVTGFAGFVIWIRRSTRLPPGPGDPR